MLILIKKDTPESAIRSLVIQLSRQGIGAARADSGGRVLLTLTGQTWTLDEQRLLALPYVEDVKRLTSPWRLADRRNHPEDTVVPVGNARIGRGFCLIAGPCAVESAIQMQAVARTLKAAGAHLLRGGAYKPRTSPYAFQGYGAGALDISAIPVLKQMTHLPVIVDPSHAAGSAALVPPLALAAVAAGADGLLIEVHDRPAAALSDAAQSLSCTAFTELAEKVVRVRKALEE